MSALDFISIYYTSTYICFVLDVRVRSLRQKKSHDPKSKRTKKSNIYFYDSIGGQKYDVNEPGLRSFISKYMSFKNIVSKYYDIDYLRQMLISALCNNSYFLQKLLKVTKKRKKKVEYIYECLLILETSNLRDVKTKRTKSIRKEGIIKFINTLALSDFFCLFLWSG